MKKILDGLAALANEADAEGNIRVADQIDNLIKVIAAYDEHAKPEEISMEPLTVTVPADKKAETEKMHERARLVMQEIVKMFKDAGEQPPMAVPASKITGPQILEFLKMAGQGAPLTGWHDLMKRLNNIKAQTSAYFAVGTASPFAGAAPAAAPQDSKIERRDTDGQVASIPTPTAGSGSGTLNTGTKGPPVPPALK